MNELIIGIIFGFLMGISIGLVISMAIMQLGFISASRKINQAKKENKNDPDDWWRNGDPAPWD